MQGWGYLGAIVRVRFMSEAIALLSDVRLKSGRMSLSHGDLCKLSHALTPPELEICIAPGASAMPRLRLRVSAMPACVPGRHTSGVPRRPSPSLFFHGLEYKRRSPPAIT